MFWVWLPTSVEEKSDERGVRIQQTQSQLERRSQRGRRAVHFLRARRSGASVLFHWRACYTLRVMLSEAKHLWLPAHDPRFFASLRMTR